MLIGSVSRNSNNECFRFGHWNKRHTRAVLVDENGSVLATETEEHPPFASPEIGWAEQDPDDWWRAAVVAIRKVLE